MGRNKDVVIRSFGPETVELIRDVKNTKIFLWKRAICTWHDPSEFIKLIETNNISVIYFEDRDNYLNKQRYIIADEDDHYWSGQWGQHPFGGRARVFVQYKSYAKKYFSEKVADNVAKAMLKQGVFSSSGIYKIIKE